MGSELDSEFQVERSDRGFPPGPPILVHGAPLAAGADSSADQPPLIAVVATVIGFAAILIFAFSKRKAARATTQEDGSDDEGTMLSAKARAQLILLKHDAKRKGAKKGNCNGKKVKHRAEAAAEPTDDDDDDEHRMEQGSGRRREEKTSKAAASLSAPRRAGTKAERATLKKDTVQLSPRPSARPSAAEEPEQVEPPRRASKH